jgi:predicted DNA-binding transcriptional regulator YafY
MALALLKKNVPLGEAVSSLAKRCQLSNRQAYRYLRHAQAVGSPLPIPETKSAFTVKLPPRLIEAVRGEAHQIDMPISDLVARALGEYLQRREPGRHG